MSCSCDYNCDFVFKPIIGDGAALFMDKRSSQIIIAYDNYSEFYGEDEVAIERGDETNGRYWCVAGNECTDCHYGMYDYFNDDTFIFLGWI